MITVSGIYKSYGKHDILKGVDLTLDQGECVGIAGSNGCGKTTLLSILAGTLKADRGSILLDGKEAFRNPKLLAEKTAYVPQENPLIGELSVRDNLLLWYRGSRREMEKDLAEGAASRLGVDRMLKQKVETLSGGMKKRLSIACALSNHASLLIMDEPGAALDLECKQEIRDYLKTYLAEGGSVILTSHELEEFSLCTGMYVLKEGILKKTTTGLTAEELIRQF